MKCWIDRYVLCPFYSREEGSVSRKIHCEGYAKGNHIHLCFDSKDAIKAHKKKYCKNDGGYKKCPIFPVIFKKYLEEE